MHSKKTCFTGGLLYNSEKRELYSADLLIEGDTIAGIGKDITCDCSRINLSGSVISPGFIDIHTHSDGLAMQDSDAGSKLCDGITTEISGNCGSSLFPDDGRNGPDKRICPFSGKVYQLTARTFGSYLEWADAKGIPLNMGGLIGHGNMRTSLAGRNDRELTQDEIESMRSCAQELLEQGAFGISLGLAYPPGCFAFQNELMTLADMVGEYGRLMTAHIRNEGIGLLKALEEFLILGQDNNCKLHISHFKAMWPPNWATLGQAIDYIEMMQEQGGDITADRYPYTAGATNLDHLLPPSYYEGGDEAELKRLRDKTCHAELEAYICETYGEDVFERVQLTEVPGQSDCNEFCGKRIADIAGILGCSPFEAYIKLNIDGNVHTAAVFHAMDEHNLHAILKLPYVCIASDASARSISGMSATGTPHPRGFGTCARFLGKYVRENALMSLCDGLYKLTAQPAERLGLTDRGYLKKGCKADLTIFDPDTIRDTATYTNPFSYSQGIKAVYVNGVLAAEDGMVVNAGAGQILRA